MRGPDDFLWDDHDVTRTATRYGRADTSFSFEAKREGTPTDLALGARRARAGALLAMALPGSMYIYQGEELGLPEVDVPPDLRQDPMYFRSGGVDPGRDGCRVPLPWAGGTPPYAFSPPDGRPTWLPQPRDWRPLTVAAQSVDPDSMLTLYRAALRLRRVELSSTDPFAWLPSDPNVLAFSRGDRFACVVNLGSAPIPLPEGAVLISSHAVDGGRLPPDAAAWLRRPRTSSVPAMHHDCTDKE